ncbi:MAG: SDR family NAD(P)-dependent oxidoreductase [Holophagaceae bacterium]|nr:SDR family NAD(P)-dependent oxidoreductase [Holophagaceae bacterium]
MKTIGNTILITGGGSGIGLGLAKAFHALGNQVIIASRRKDLLTDIVSKHKGMASYELDVKNTDQIKSVTEEILRDFPNVNMLINNSGIMRTEDIKTQNDMKDVEDITATNLLGPIRLTAAMLPSLLKQPYATIINVSSGLGFVPMATTPTYCATKAALHSYSQSLRYQLKDTKISVIELIPPYVATDLLNGANDPMAMPLDEFIQEVMEILTTEPHPYEICVKKVMNFRLAAESINFDSIFRRFNDGVAQATAK